MRYIDETLYPESYPAEILAHKEAILKAASTLSGERIEVFEKTLTIVFSHRIRIEYDWIDHRNQLFLATREDAEAENQYNEDMYWDYYEESHYDYY